MSAWVLCPWLDISLSIFSFLHVHRNHANDFYRNIKKKNNLNVWIMCTTNFHIDFCLFFCNYQLFLATNWLSTLHWMQWRKSVYSFFSSTQQHVGVLLYHELWQTCLCILIFITKNRSTYARVYDTGMHPYVTLTFALFNWRTILDVHGKIPIK